MPCHFSTPSTPYESILFMPTMAPLASASLQDDEPITQQELLLPKRFPSVKFSCRVGARFPKGRIKFLRMAVSTGIQELDQHLGASSSSASYASSKSLSKHFGNRTDKLLPLTILVPDADTLTKQTAFFQHPKVQALLLMQSVEEQIRRTKGLPAYVKLKAIMKDDKLATFCFANSSTTQLPANTDAASSPLMQLLTSIHYYQVLIEKLNLHDSYRVVFLTTQLSAVELAKNQFGIAHAYLIEDFVAKHMEPAYADILVTTDTATSSESQKQQMLYAEHIKPSEIDIGIENGKYLRGKFQRSRENFTEATVLIQSSEDDTQQQQESNKKPSDIPDSVFVCGIRDQNRAVHDDIVAVEVLPRENWVVPTGLLLEADDEEEENAEEKEEENVIAEKTNKTKKASAAARAASKHAKPTARVVGIIKRGWREYCGMLKAVPEGGADNINQRRRQLFCAADKRIPLVIVETQRAEYLRNQRIVVTLDRWSRNSRYPHGHVSKILGAFGDRNTENEVILVEHQIKHTKFSDQVLSCLPPTPWIITQKDLDERQDLRHLDIVSIDPPGCTDIDDALHCRPLEPNNAQQCALYEVGVHIADVSHFVRPNNAMDREAAERCTTVYLTDRRIDMLPDLLSSNLCSLRPYEDRFAFSVLWIIDINTGEYDMSRTVYTKSIIRSRQAFTYERAQQTIDDASAQGSIATNLRVLNTIAKKLKEKRRLAGALCLESTEVRFAVDSETHDPIDVRSKQLFETNSLVEEFMLLANVTVAGRIFAEFPEFAILRRHPAPPKENFEPLEKAVAEQGIQIKADSNKQLAESLDRAVKPNNRYFNTMLRLMTTRCMMQALYFCSGTQKYDQFYHYGLAAPIYTHFTSPIRRYADVLVHRLLAAAIGADTTYTELLSRQFAQRECNEMNFRHRMAQYAGRASVTLYTMLFFRGKSVVEPAYVVGIKRNAVQVLVPKYGLESAMYLRGEDGFPAFTYDEKENVHVAINNANVRLRLFMPLTVHITVDQSSLQHHKLQLRLVEPHVPGFSYVVPAAAAVTSAATMSKEAEAAQVLQLT